LGQDPNALPNPEGRKIVKVEPLSQRLRKEASTATLTGGVHPGLTLIQLKEL